MMNILLVPTNQLNCSLPGINVIPGLGLLQLAGACEKRNIPCKIINLSQFNIFSGENKDSIFDAVTEKILSYNPDVIGFSTLITNSIIAIELCRKIKLKKPSVFTVLGGPGVSYCSQGIIREFPFIDAIIRGEAENAFPAFILQLQRKKKEISEKGLVWRENDDIADYGWPDPIGNLDDLPLPYYDGYLLIEGNKMIKPSVNQIRTAARIEIGRGCPYNCIFCSTSLFFKRKHRLKSVDRIVKELMHTKAKLNCTHIQFVHDLLTLKNNYIEKLCKAIKKYIPSIKWYCESRLDTINGKLLKQMADAGCVGLFFGIEAASKRMQKIVRKNLDLSILDNVLKTLKQLNIFTVFSFVVGFPEEKKSDLEKTLMLAMKIKFFSPGLCDIQIHYLRVDPGSDIYNKNLKNLRYNDLCAPFQNGSNLPHTCNELKAIIKKNPGLFPSDFYLHNPDVSNEDKLKICYIENLINNFMNKSLWFAYKILGEKLPSVIIRNLDKIELPLFKISAYKNISKMAESMNSLIYELLKNNSTACEMFNTLATYEIAILDILFEDIPVKIIDVLYNPQIIINDLIADKINMKPGNNEKKLLHYIISRDKETDKIKCREIPENYISFLEKF